MPCGLKSERGAGDHEGCSSLRAAGDVLRSTGKAKHGCKQQASEGLEPGIGSASRSLSLPFSSPDHLLHLQPPFIASKQSTSAETERKQEDRSRRSISR